MKLILLSVLLTMMIFPQTKYSDINTRIKEGNFTEAKEMIDQKLNTENLNTEEQLKLQFEKERLDRIRKDFNKTSDDVVKYVKKYYPNIT